MDPTPSPDASQRRRRAATAGHRGDAVSAEELAKDSDASVRVAALGALARLGRWDAEHLARALEDPETDVRRRACELTGQAARWHDETAQWHGEMAGSPAQRVQDDELEIMATTLLAALDDDPMIAEAAAWALGELGARSISPDGASEQGGGASEQGGGASEQGGGASEHVPDRPTSTVETGAGPGGVTSPWGTVVRRLITVAEAHSDLLVRESAVAALGSIGEPAGLPAVLLALTSKPALRRRAAVALAAFDDPRADEALRGCLEDRDWQVREIAEELLGQALEPRPSNGADPAHRSL